MIGTLITLVLAAPLSVQASAICDALQDQLRQPVRVIGNTAEVRQYASALARQNILIRKIKNDMRSYGCTSGSIIVYGSPNADMCAQIGDALVEAQTERDNIAADRDRMLRTQREDRSENSREKIMAALNANGCFDETAPVPTSAEPRKLSPMDPYRDPFSEQPDNSDYPQPGDMPQEGGLRTLCVRTCDGAFFPISSNASPLDFRAQAAQCERMCPGAETELYYHAMKGEESTDMVSARTGQPYTALPTAFAYKNGSAANRSPSCGCNMAAYHNEMQRQDAQQSTPSQDYSSVTRITSPKSDATPKPAEIKPEVKAEPIPERDYDPKTSKVRVVGPQFLPEETSRIDLRKPALEGAQPIQ